MRSKAVYTHVVQSFGGRQKLAVKRSVSKTEEKLERQDQIRGSLVNNREQEQQKKKLPAPLPWNSREHLFQITVMFGQKQSLNN